MKVQLLFFASVREQLQLGQHSHQTAVDNLGELRRELAARSGWQVLASKQTLAAVNQQISADSQPLAEGDEVAFFPFMTGG